jgi:hypothetical protein
MWGSLDISKSIFSDTSKKPSLDKSRLPQQVSEIVILCFWDESCKALKLSRQFSQNCRRWRIRDQGSSFHTKPDSLESVSGAKAIFYGCMVVGRSQITESPSGGVGGFPLICWSAGLGNWESAYRDGRWSQESIKWPEKSSKAGETGAWFRGLEKSCGRIGRFYVAIWQCYFWKFDVREWWTLWW